MLEVRGVFEARREEVRRSRMTNWRASAAGAPGAGVCLSRADEVRFRARFAGGGGVQAGGWWMGGGRVGGWVKGRVSDSKWMMMSGVAGGCGEEMVWSPWGGGDCIVGEAGAGRSHVRAGGCVHFGGEVGWGGRMGRVDLLRRGRGGAGVGVSY